MASVIHPTAQAGWSGPGAKDYEAGRPGYPRAAVELIGAELIAVAPVAAMRAQLIAAVPTARVLEGTAERIPLDHGAVHAVTVAQAFHWFDVPRAAAEIARVLRLAHGLAPGVTADVPTRTIIRRARVRPRP